MVARDALRALEQGVPGGARDDRSIGGDNENAGGMSIPSRSTP